jgi:hypothetical protein
MEYMIAFATSRVNEFGEVLLPRVLRLVVMNSYAYSESTPQRARMQSPFFHSLRSRGDSLIGHMASFSGREITIKCIYMV